MPIEKKGFLSGVQIVFLLVLLIGQTFFPIVFTGTTESNRPGDDQIIWEVIGLPEYMDPHKNYESAGGWVHANI